MNYWTGETLFGGRTVIAQAPLDLIPLLTRMGAIVPKIPEDVMTLVTAKESGNSSVKRLDDRRVYELMPTNSRESVRSPTSKAASLRARQSRSRSPEEQ